MSENTLDLTELRAIAEQAEALLSGKEYFLGSLVNRFRQAANSHPHDQTIRIMQATLEKRLQKNSSIDVMSQREIQALYDDVGGLGNRTHFKEELGDLLFIDRVEKVAHKNEGFIHTLRAREDQLEFRDQAAISELEGLWSNAATTEVKSRFTESGRRGLEIELEGLGFSSPTVEVAAQDQNFLVYAAEVGTSRGRIPFLIPAEVKQGSVLMPSVFVSGNEFKDLNVQNLKGHLEGDVAFQRISTPTAVLSTLNRLASLVNPQPVTKESDLDDVQIPLSGPALYADLIGHTDPSLNENRIIDDRMPQVQMPKALEGISESAIRETLIEAGLSFDRDLVLGAKSVVANELKIAAIGHDRITIDSEFDGGITLATNIVGKGGRKKVEVPVEIKEGRILMPGSFISGPDVRSFDSESLRAFANEVEGAEFDPFLSDKYDMNFNKLHQRAMRKAAHGDFIEATEILSIINEKFGPEFHRIAHDDLMDLLKVGYNEEEKPLTAMEKFTQEAAAKAADKENQIRMMANPMLFYPKDK
jgi:hypothetical protein